MPLIGSQLSMVQLTPSSGIQRRAGLTVEHRVAGLDPGADVRCRRRGCRSGTFAMPVTGSQLSTVQLTPSSGSSGVPAWQSSTASQVSVPVQTSVVVAEAVGRVRSPCR